MKDFEKLFVLVINDFVDDYSISELIEEFFGEISPGELFLEMYNSGMIPEDKLEEFLQDE